jgi:protein tyrosine/serine phosphatase
MGTELNGIADIKLIVDLRYAAERVMIPVTWPDDFGGRTLAHGSDLQMEAPHEQAERLAGVSEHIKQFYRVMYATLPLTDPYRDLFATALQDMASLGGGALIHCTAGKDRTGILIALALHALGIERAAIMTDFMATRDAPGMELLRAELAARLDPATNLLYSEEKMDELLTIHPEYLETMFSAITQEHGSVDGFLDSLGLTVERRTAWRDAALH